MIATRSLRWKLAAIVFAALMAPAVLAQSQAPPAKVFEPHHGQPGKDVVWVPTSPALVEEMLDLANVTAADFVIDLGSGDGRTVIAAAKRGARAMGIEYDAEMVELSKGLAEKAGVADKATFAKADLFESDFSQASVITMFLLTDINLRLRPTILNLKPGTRIVTNTFKMGDWQEDGSSTVEGECSSWCTAYLWIVPAKVEGAWRTAGGTLTLSQSFQMISGTIGSGSTTTAITEGRLRGDEITFTAGDAHYAGKVVDGTTIRGSVKKGTATTPWTATRNGS